MKSHRISHVIACGALLVAPRLARADLHHVHLAAPNATEAVRWYVEHMECAAIADRIDAVDCGPVDLVFVVRPTLGGSNGTAVDHIGFSFADLEGKMAALEEVGVRGSGVRLQRFDDGSLVRDIDGLFAIGFVFDPWGTRIELVEDPDRLGFHHVHLVSSDPSAALAWYQSAFGGELARLKGQIEGLLLGDVWLLASPSAERRPAPTESRSIDHIAFVTAELEATVARAREGGGVLLQDAAVPDGGRSRARRAFLTGPDGVGIAVVEPGWEGVDTVRARAVDASVPRPPYQMPRTPWGEPDLQGIWTSNDAYGIPLERPEDDAGKETLSAEEAAARRERGTLRSIWGYDREWRDVTVDFGQTLPDTQVAMVVDPPDGRLPPMTEKGEELAAVARAAREEPLLPAGPEDLPVGVRCITRGGGILGNMPAIYNNGLQIVQSPGYVAIQREMMHETRVIPTDGRPHLSGGVSQWLGDSRGHWEGDTLVVDVTNINGRAPFRGSDENLHLMERFTRLDEDTIEYRFTVDDPTIWTRPWTGMFRYKRDDGQYELVEYACHEGNYGMTNTLSAARAREKAAAEAARR